MQFRGFQPRLTLCILGADPAESRVGKGDRRGALWFFGPAVGREIVQRGQRGNGSAFMTEPPPSFPSPSPSPSPSLPFLSPPLFSQQLFFFSLCLSSFLTPLPSLPFPSLHPFTLQEGVKKSFLMGFSQIVFTDISEILCCKENIWTYFSLIGSLMVMFCVPVLSTPTAALLAQSPA